MVMPNVLVAPKLGRCLSNFNVSSWQGWYHYLLWGTSSPRVRRLETKILQLPSFGAIGRGVSCKISILVEAGEADVSAAAWRIRLGRVKMPPIKTKKGRRRG